MRENILYVFMRNRTKGGGGTENMTKQHGSVEANKRRRRGGMGRMRNGTSNMGGGLDWHKEETDGAEEPTDTWRH